MRAHEAKFKHQLKTIRYPPGRGDHRGRVYRGAGLDPRIKIKLWEEYIAGELPLAEIAIKHKMSLMAVHNIVTKERWPARRRALEQELFDNWHLKIQQLQHRHVAKVMARQLDHSELLGAELLKQLKTGKLTAKDFQNVAQAFKSYEDVAARAAGLDRMPALDREQTAQPQGKIAWNLTVQDEGGPIQDAEFQEGAAGSDLKCLPGHTESTDQEPVDPQPAHENGPRIDPDTPVATQMAPDPSERPTGPAKGLSSTIPDPLDEPVDVTAALLAGFG